MLSPSAKQPGTRRLGPQTTGLVGSWSSALGKATGRPVGGTGTDHILPQSLPAPWVLGPVFTPWLLTGSGRAQDGAPGPEPLLLEPAAVGARLPLDPIVSKVSVSPP